MAFQLVSMNMIKTKDCGGWKMSHVIIYFCYICCHLYTRNIFNAGL